MKIVPKNNIIDVLSVDSTPKELYEFLDGALKDVGFKIQEDGLWFTDLESPLKTQINKDHFLLKLNGEFKGFTSKDKIDRDYVILNEVIC